MLLFLSPLTAAQPGSALPPARASWSQTQSSRSSRSIRSAGFGSRSGSIARSASKVRSCLRCNLSVGRVAVRAVQRTLQGIPDVAQGSAYRAVGRMLHGEIGSQPHLQASQPADCRFERLPVSAHIPGPRSLPPNLPAAPGASEPSARVLLPAARVGKTVGNEPAAALIQVPTRPHPGASSDDGPTSARLASRQRPVPERLAGWRS